MNLPNIITLLRFFLIPAFIYLFVRGDYPKAIGVFIFAGFTDLLDGAAARFLRQRTKLGTILDPAADKLLMLVTFLVLAVKGIVPPWLTLLVICRDLWIISGVLVLKKLRKTLYVKPTKVSKLNTFCQLLTIFFAFSYTFASAEPAGFLGGYSELFHEWLNISLYLTTGMTVVSGLQYTRIGWLILKGDKEYANLSVKENQVNR